jgi:hypothetical protein
MRLGSTYGTNQPTGFDSPNSFDTTKPFSALMNHQTPIIKLKKMDTLNSSTNTLLSGWLGDSVELTRVSAASLTEIEAKNSARSHLTSAEECDRND